MVISHKNNNQCPLHYDYIPVTDSELTYGRTKALID